MASVSPPTWRCGLKRPLLYPTGLICLSPPTWRCGLKLAVAGIQQQHAQVTSHVEVWIETMAAKSLFVIFSVTSHVEVWIETFILMDSNSR